MYIVTPPPPPFVEGSENGTFLKKNPGKKNNPERKIK